MHTVACLAEVLVKRSARSACGSDTVLVVHASSTSYSGGSYQQHLGMLEQWIDSNGRPQATPTSAEGRRRKGAKTAGQWPLLLLHLALRQSVWLLLTASGLRCVHWASCTLLTRQNT